jgi:uronate dehydrogenase
MPRILLTGAAGGIGTSLRALLPPIYPDLLLNWMSKSASETKAEIYLR